MLLNSTQLEAALASASGNVTNQEEDDSHPVFELLRFNSRTDLRTKPLLQAVACNGMLVLALANNHIIRIQISEDVEFEDIQLGKLDDQLGIHKIFLDPTGNHLIISMATEENLYLHSSMEKKKPKPLPKLKGVVIESIAWDLQNQDPKTTKDILIGTTQGEIYECCIENAKEVSLKLVSRYL